MRVTGTMRKTPTDTAPFEIQKKALECPAPFRRGEGGGQLAAAAQRARA